MALESFSLHPMTSTEGTGRMASDMERWVACNNGLVKGRLSLVLCGFYNMHVQGRIVYSNGDTFDGQFSSGQIEGEGTLKCVNGVEYSGDWKHSQVWLSFLSLSLSLSLRLSPSLSLSIAQN